MEQWDHGLYANLLDLLREIHQVLSVRKTRHKRRANQAPFPDQSMPLKQATTPLIQPPPGLFVQIHSIQSYHPTFQRLAGTILNGSARSWTVPTKIHCSGKTMPQKSRLDQHLVDLALAPSRARAQALIKAGAVMVAGVPARKASQTVPPGADIKLTADPNPWVSRAGLKLAHALKLWNLAPTGATALDVGASTGGFTEVLLVNGAAEVFALDVGHGQLHPDLQNHPQVQNLEGINAKSIPTGLIPPVDWIVSDVSFISLTKALPGPLSRAKPGARLVALIKPQFELSKAEIGKGGIVTDPAAHNKARANVHAFLHATNWIVEAEADSPIKGGDGNREFLISARNGA